MNAATYDFVVNRDCMSFRFWSEGPKGKIEKGVLFTRFDKFPNDYHIGFGDVDKDGYINDQVTTDNEDTEKVLATVARCVIFFTYIFPEAVIYVEGSTASRTRRYQMGINKFWGEIHELFEVYGMTFGGEVERFRPGKNYMAFGGMRKYCKFEL